MLYSKGAWSPWSVQITEQIALEVRLAYHDHVQPRSRHLVVNQPSYSWWWCDRGSLRVQSQERHYAVSKGQWIFLPAYCEREHWIEPETILISLGFRAIWPMGMPVVETNGPVVGCDVDLHFRQVALDAVAAAQAIQAQRRRTSVPAEHVLVQLRFRGAMNSFVSALFQRVVALGGWIQPPGCGDERLDYVLEQMRRELQAGPMPIERWCEEVDLSRSQLNRLCRALLGMSLRERRDQVLVDELRQRLIGSDQSIKAMASQLGFVDTAHLCRWFRRKTGHRPSDIREWPTV